MHEESLVRSLLRQVRQLTDENSARSVVLVKVEVGLLAGVEPELFRLAFERLAPPVLGEDCRLELRCVPLVIHCQSCGRDFETEELAFVCPDCGSSTVDVRGGDRVILDSVTLGMDSSVLPNVPHAGASA